MKNICISKNDNEFKKILKKNISGDDFVIIDKALSNNIVIKNILLKNNIKFLTIKASENIKSLEYYSKIVEEILKLGINRSSKIISIGGGTIGDLSGFIASTALRGIEHIMIPTTLLAMVDSSIGGKTGINSNYGKNLIGSFFIPKKIIIHIKFLESLSKRELSCGFAEVIKYACISSNPLKKELLNFNFTNFNKNTLQKIIIESIKTKLFFTKDFKELSNGPNSRAILNFGHTFGHAIEGLNSFKSNIKHGEAVALGMMIEMEISKMLNLKPTFSNELEKLLVKYKLPRNFRKFISINNIDQIMEKIKIDKKSNSKNINLILISKNKGVIKKLSFDDLKKLTINLIQ